MKRTKLLSFLIPFLCLLLPIVSFAKDTDIYMASGEGVQSNILIIFDNSASMNGTKVSRTYKASETYEPAVYLRDTVYKYNTTKELWELYGATVADSEISDVPCNKARTNLSTKGQHTGNTNSNCDGTPLQLRTGNYLNYQYSGGDEVTKLEIAKYTIKELIDTVGDVKIGMMVFNAVVDDPSIHGIGEGEGPGDFLYHKNTHGGRIVSDVMELDEMVDDPDDTVEPIDKITHQEELKKRIDQITANSFTPLSETLYEAGLYFKGATSYFNPGVDYAGRSPVEYSCQKNYIIIMTDGDPTRDDGYRPGDNETGEGDDCEAHHHIFWSAIGDQDGDGSEPLCRPGIDDTIEAPCSTLNPNRLHYTLSGTDWRGTDYLDDIALFLFKQPILPGKQNIITYTIGYDTVPQNNLLGRTAENAGGKYKIAANAAQLADAFQQIVGEILLETSSFVAPIVPVSRMERQTAGDKLYLALFQPTNESMWNGNIKKFIIAQPEGYLSDCPYNPDFAIGEVLDVNCNKALNDDGTISSASTSLWVTKSPDGSDVEVGGIGGILKNQSTREIYTYFKLDTNLTVASNEFDTDISPDLFGLGSDTTARDKLVNFIYGQDAYDEDADTNTTEKRHWILGSFLHSRPLVIHYGSLASRPSVIYAGGNDGMLHAFDDTTGEEIWGFVPLDQLIRLQALSLPTSKDTPFVDGSPKAYVNYEYNADGSIKAVNEAILIFGERRGGNRYYALDVTNPSVPKFLWYISKDERVYGTTTFASDYGQLGQSWSTPAIGKIACQETDPHAILVGDKWVKWVVFIGGGYDTNQDNNPLTEADDEGRAVYVIDIKDGSLVKAFVHDTGDYSSMDYCIPSDITKLDVDGNGNVDRLYVGDLGGQMWRFDIGDLVPANWTGRIIFQSNPGKDTSTGRKIFYPPDVTLEKGDYEMLVFGTGDRENPQEENVSNRIYALKDKNLTGTILNENDLYDVTGNELQTTTDPATRNAILSALNAAYGWWITLGTGEKSLAAPIVYYRAAYLTTFIPTATDDPCQARFGTARMYVLNYSNGMAVLNLDGSLDNVISTTDRSESIGTAIPSGVIITFIGGTTVAYTGVGGGVNSPPLTTTKSIFPMTWRIVF